MEFDKHKKIMPQIVGKFQYIYSSDKGEVSLVKFLNYCKDGDNFWEIYSTKGNLFEDVERFDSKKEAEARIREVL